MFSLLLDEHKINDEIAPSMRGWKHSGFSVDDSVRIEAGYKEGMRRLVEYVSRCLFSLSRMVSVTGDGKILYRASHTYCLPFPLSGNTKLVKGIPRNFEASPPKIVEDAFEEPTLDYGFISASSMRRLRPCLHLIPPL